MPYNLYKFFIRKHPTVVNTSLNVYQRYFMNMYMLQLSLVLILNLLLLIYTNKNIIENTFSFNGSAKCAKCSFFPKIKMKNLLKKKKRDSCMNKV